MMRFEYQSDQSFNLTSVTIAVFKPNFMKIHEKLDFWAGDLQMYSDTVQTSGWDVQVYRRAIETFTDRTILPCMVIVRVVSVRMGRRGCTDFKDRDRYT